MWQGIFYAAQPKKKRKNHIRKGSEGGEENMCIPFKGEYVKKLRDFTCDTYLNMQL